MGKPRKGKGTGSGRGSNKKKAQQVRGDGITPQQEMFCQTYSANGHNGAAAYLKAYPVSTKYTAQVRAVQAAKLLTNTKILLRISELDAQLATASQHFFEITKERIAQETAATAFATAGDFFEWGYREEPLYNKKGDAIVDQFGAQKTKTVPYMRVKPSSELTPVQLKAITAVELTYSQSGREILSVKIGNKQVALDKLAVWHGMNKSTVEITGKDGGPIESVTHTLPDLDEVSDPKAVLRAFEAFRSGQNGQGTRH